LRTQLDVAEHLGEGGPLVTDLRADVDRMTALVRDLLTLARVDASPVARDTERVDVPAVLREVAAGYPGRPVHVADGPPEVAVAVRRADLARVLTNLVDNALRHARSRVELAARETAEGVVVTVTDDGPGIAPADRERVFERFTRLDDSRARDAGGTGLGLAIVRELVARNGGTVEVVDSTGGGACLRVVLPRAGTA
jgi:signal transduction histidine kinase